MNKVVFALVLAANSTFVLADDFTETLDNARAAYDEGDISGAKEELTYASQLLSQMRGKALQGFLPQPLVGWDQKQSKGQGSGGGLGMLGGGTTANATYVLDGKKVQISIIADSPMVQGMGALFSNMALAGSQGTMKRINRQKVMVKKDGSLMTMINKRIVVEVKGNASADHKEEYFKAIDFKGLKSF